VGSAAPWRRTLAAAIVLVASILAGIAGAIVALVLLFLTFALNDGVPRLGLLAATVFMLIVSFCVAFGGHLVADRIAPPRRSHSESSG
jgi:uncharacterized membrane protein